MVLRGAPNIFRNIGEMHFETSKNCNLSCIYCYAHQTSSSSNSLIPLEIAFKYINLIFKRTCAKNINIVFHGGEPLLQSTRWFYNLIEYAIKKGEKYFKKLHVLMQSNCTLLDNEKINLIEKYNIIVGTALDGPPYINDLSRGKGKIVLKNIQKLKEINCFGGVICVINKYNYEKMNNILNFFEEESISRISANVCRLVGRGKKLVPLSSNEIFIAYTKIYNYLEETDGKGVVESNIAAKLNRYICPPTLSDFKEILICSHPFCGGGITTIICDTDGNLYPCGCSANNPKYFLGNIDLFSENIFISAVKNLQTKNSKYFKECQSCDAAQICSFGCPAFDYIDVSTAESECNANKMFYSFLESIKKSKIKMIIKNMEERTHEMGERNGTISKHNTELRMP